MHARPASDACRTPPPLPLLLLQVTLVTTALFTNLTRGSFSPVGDFNASLRNTNASVFTTLGAKNVLLQELSFHDFSPLYLETKGFFCCKIPDEVYDVSP